MRRRHPDKTRILSHRFLKNVVPLLAFFVAASAWSTISGQSNDLKPVAITAAKIVVRPGTTIENGTVILRDGLIESVGTDVEVPFDARVLEGEGLVVYAGFIDAGSTKGLPSGDEDGRQSGTGADNRSLDLATEVVAFTREANRKGLFPDYESARFVAIERADEKAWRESGFTAVHVMPSGALMAGTSTLVALNDWQKTPTRDSVLLDSVAAIGGWRAQGGGYPSSLMGSVAHLRQMFLDAQHYKTSWEIYNRVKRGIPRPPRDPAMEAVGDILDGRIPLVFPATNIDDLYRINTLASEFGFQYVFDGIEEGYDLTDELREHGAPIILRIGFPDKPELGGTASGRQGRGGFGGFGGRGRRGSREPDKRIPVAKGIHEEQLKDWEQDVGNPGVLAAAGIPFVLSTAGTEDAEKFIENLRLAIEHGLSSDDALMALTLRPAELFGLAEQLGSVETGKMANLVVMSGDLSDKESAVLYTIVNGVVFDIAKEDEDETEDAEDADAEGGDEAITPPGGEETAPQGERRGRRGRGQGRRGGGGGADEEEQEIKTADWPIETDESRKPTTVTNGNVLIQGATVITAINGTLENTSILVRDGIIAEIGRDLQAPVGFTVVDGTGAWVMPGIIDCHSHMVGGGNEGTMSVTPEVRCIDNMRSSDLTLFRAAAGGVTAANVLHGSANTIGGQRIVIQMKYGAGPDELLFKGFLPGIKFALGENVIRSENRYPNTRMGVESVLRISFEEARRYKAVWAKYNALSDEEKDRTIPPRRDLRLEALQQVMDNELLVHCHCYNAGEILMLLQTFTKYGIENLTLEHGLEAFKVAPEVVSFGKNGARLSTFADFWGYKVEAYDAVPYNVALMNAAGGIAILNSDSGERVRRLYQDAAKMVRWGGISFQDAIRTITLNPAIALHIDDQVGSIEVGKKADLALFNGHPLNTFSRCFMTLIDGEVVFERAGERGGPYPLPPKTGVAASMPEINADGVYAITNTSINPITGPPIQGGTLVIAEGKIAAMGQNVPVPEGATVVDGSNLEVYPGMLDGGNTVAVSDLGLTDAAERGDMKPDLMTATALKPDSPLVGVTRFTGITSSVTIPTGGLISGQSSIVQLDGWNFDEMAFVPNLALEISLPRDSEQPDFGGRRGRRGRGQAAEETEPRPEPELTPKERVLNLFADAREYHRVKTAAADRGSELPKFNSKLEAVVPYAFKQRPVVIRVGSAADILDAIDFAQELDANVILRDSGTESWKVAQQLKESGIPILIGAVTRSPSSSYEPYDSVYALPAKLHEAGVLFGFYSGEDAHARDLPLSPGMAVAFGLSEQAALEAVTMNTAKIFGVDHQLGSLEVGKRADIIVTDRNPLQATSNVIHMFINGRPVDVDDNRHTELYDKYGKRIKRDTGSDE